MEISLKTEIATRLVGNSLIIFPSGPQFAIKYTDDGQITTVKIYEVDAPSVKSLTQANRWLLVPPRWRILVTIATR